jgi:hypothetical protein
MTLPADAVAWERVRRLAFVPFLADGRCALLPAGDGLALPLGEVLAGEDPVPDTGLAIDRDGSFLDVACDRAVPPAAWIRCEAGRS